MKKTMKPGDMFNAFKAKTKKKSEFAPVESAVQKGKNWIAGAIKHPGALHRELGVKEGAKIPPKKLAAAAKKGGKEGKRARLAETLKSFHHKKMTQKEDDAYDKKHGIKEGSKRDIAQDKRNGIKDKKMKVQKKCKVCGK